MNGIFPARDSPSGFGRRQRHCENTMFSHACPCSVSPLPIPKHIFARGEWGELLCHGRHSTEPQYPQPGVATTLTACNDIFLLLSCAYAYTPHHMRAPPSLSRTRVRTGKAHGVVIQCMPYLTATPQPRSTQFLATASLPRWIPFYVMGDTAQSRSSPNRGLLRRSLPATTYQQERSQPRSLAARNFSHLPRCLAGLERYVTSARQRRAAPRRVTSSSCPR
jgi:hypothetical protein